MAKAWFMELEGDSIDLDRLVDAFTVSPVRIWNEDGRYRFSADDLNDSDDAQYVRSELHQMLLRINALARLQWGADYDDVRPGGLGHPNDHGGTSWYDAGTIFGRMRISGKMSIIGPDGEIVPNPPSRLPQELQLAAVDPNVDDALYFLQRAEPSWGELYKAYEVVRDDAGDPGGRGWTSRDDLSRFTRTANHQAAAGRQARHARAATEPPANPMSLEDAWIFVRRFVSAWITEKLEP